MIQLTLNAATPDELHAQLQALLGGVGATTLPAPVAPFELKPTATEAAAEAAKPKRGRPSTKKDAEPQIRANPEDRQESEATDSADVEQQDKADEQAEKQTEAPKTLTHDDVRQKLGAYVKAFGMPAAQEDGPKIIQAVLKANGLPHEGKTKISELPDDQKVLKAMLDGVDEAITKNPFKREKAA